MPLFRFDNAMVLFIHVPKTGGTSIEQALTDMGGCPALLLETAAPDYSRSTPQHMPADILERFVPAEFYDLHFAVTRDPRDRMISEYRMRQSARQRRGQPALSFADWVDLAFTRYGQNPYAFDNHIRPQSDLIPEGTPVFRFEDGLDAPLRMVTDRLGRAPVKPPHLRRGAAGPVEVLPETAARLAAFYRADYDRFGYAPEATGS